MLLIALVGWFGHGLWSNRDIWADVYTLNDAKRPESERLDAALRLARNPRLDDGPRMEMALQKGLPELARYLLAESVSTEPVAHDPRAYALAVARSEGWPDWLRLLLARRLAYGAGRGYAIPREALDELKRHSDPMIGLWATYSLAVLPRTGPDPALTAELEQAARAQGPTGELAGRLLDAPADRRGAGARAPPRRGHRMAPPPSPPGRRDLAGLGGPRSTRGAGKGIMRPGDAGDAPEPGLGWRGPVMRGGLMDLSRLQELKKKLVNDKDLLPGLGVLPGPSRDDPAFIDLGEPVESRVPRGDLAAAGRRCTPGPR